MPIKKKLCCTFVSMFVYVFVGSPITPVPRQVPRRCLTVAAVIIIVIIIITLVGKPSRTIDLLGSSFLIHAKTSRGTYSAIGKPWNVFSMFRTFL